MSNHRRSRTMRAKRWLVWQWKYRLFAWVLFLCWLGCMAVMFYLTFILK